MSVEQFRARISRTQVHPNDLRWMPSWLQKNVARTNQLSKARKLFSTSS